MGGFSTKKCVADRSDTVRCAAWSGGCIDILISGCRVHVAIWAMSAHGASVVGVSCRVREKRKCGVAL